MAVTEAQFGRATERTREARTVAADGCLSAFADDTVQIQ